MLDTLLIPIHHRPGRTGGGRQAEQEQAGKDENGAPRQHGITPADQTANAVSQAEIAQAPGNFTALKRDQGVIRRLKLERSGETIVERKVSVDETGSLQRIRPAPHREKRPRESAGQRRPYTRPESERQEPDVGHDEDDRSGETSGAQSAHAPSPHTRQPQSAAHWSECRKDVERAAVQHRVLVTLIMPRMSTSAQRYFGRSERSDAVSAMYPHLRRVSLWESGTAPARGITRIMNICLVVDSLDIGGGERHVVDLARALEGRGHAVTIACSISGALAEHLAGSCVAVVPLLGHLVKRSCSGRYAWRLRQLIAGERFDLVHGHIYASQVAATVATLGSGLPLVLTEHTEGRWQGWRQRGATRWCLGRANHVIAVSRMIHTRLAEEFRLPMERVTLIPNAVPRRAPGESGGAPQLARFTSGALRVGVIGRLSPEKGHAVFLDAVSRIAPHLPDVCFVIVGGGILMPALRAQAERLGLQRHVHFLGEHTNARSIMAGLDLLVVPSLSEGTPLVVLEALACGVPVVASNVGGIPEQITHNREGLLVPPGDPDALARALLGLLCEPSHLTGLGRAIGRRGAEDGHAAMVGRVEAVYRSVLAAQSGSTRPDPASTSALRR